MYDAVVEVEEALLPELLSAAVRLQVEELPDDVSFDQVAGDWWINVQASSTASGAYVSALDFDVTHTNFQLTVRNDSGEIVFGPVGEGVKPISGIGREEVFKLEEDRGQGEHGGEGDGHQIGFHGFVLRGYGVVGRGIPRSF